MSWPTLPFMAIGSGDQRPLVMGILNVTEDSFSDGGKWFTVERAIAHGRDLIAQGADVVDVGGESSRPGAVAVDVDEEIRRVVPVIEALHGEVRLSVDTVKPEVARAAVAAGVSLINDVSATLGPVAADLGVGWIAMHRQGTPQTMQDNPRYVNVVDEVTRFLLERASDAADRGVGEIWIDPGIGFGKTVAHNLTLLGHLDELVAHGWPVAVGTSRKMFVGVAGSRSEEILPVADRLPGSLATATWAMELGAGLVRVHDVAATLHAARLVGPIRRGSEMKVEVAT